MHTKKPKQVYISHTRGDQEIASAVIGELQKNNIRVWDESSMSSSGTNLNEVIQDAFDSSDAIIAILSEHSYSSNWVRAEIEHALFDEKYKGRFFPVFLSNDKSELSRLPWVLSRIKHLQLRPDESPMRLGVKIVKNFLDFINQEQKNYGS